MAKLPKVDPYADYKDGNCRDVSGQIVPCGSDQVVSPPKYPKGHPLATDDDESPTTEDK